MDITRQNRPKKVILAKNHFKFVLRWNDDPLNPGFIYYDYKRFIRMIQQIANLLGEDQNVILQRYYVIIIGAIGHGASVQFNGLNVHHERLYFSVLFFKTRSTPY